MASLRDRPTGDILVLMIAGTVCFSILASGLIIAIISIWEPDVDVSGWIARMTGVINTLIGLLAGFLAGRVGAGSSVGTDKTDVWDHPPKTPPVEISDKYVYPYPEDYRPPGAPRVPGAHRGEPDDGTAI